MRRDSQAAREGPGLEGFVEARRREGLGVPGTAVQHLLHIGDSYRTKEKALGPL